MDIDALKSAIEKSWSKETCYPDLSEKWTPDNPALGQCAVTALVIQDYFGGEISYCKHLHHYWNKLQNEKMIDLTASQFPKETPPCQDETRNRDYLLENASSLAAKTKDRYLLLKSRVASRLPEQQ